MQSVPNPTYFNTETGTTSRSQGSEVDGTDSQGTQKK